MPRIPTYPRQGTVSGQGTNVLANAGAAAVIGNAVANFGQSAEGLSNSVVQRGLEIKKEEQYYSTQRIGTLVNDDASTFAKDSLGRKGTDAFNSMEWTDE